ncbi:putative protein OS=Streptomyces aurantiogriseus OX=66870 GN=GCM10010251_62330 PE=4 SV=1 [Streptomyces aurantiogriseus]|uniref:Uncharacterized protein n=1 Tax=Streptomyces aurantiogriseus TaxID=66870 RepID=A0A918FH35_9ACTN|nr:hypothetical protein GCM10010251_62330 [Streptomyces aurantiogriseus]
MKKPCRQPYWYRLRIRTAAEPWAGWKGLGGPEFRQVPHGALRDSSLEAWATAFLQEARSELDDLRGDLLIECYDRPAPGVGTEPVHSAQVPLGPGQPLI